ncbi:LacI family DNA-binding transcriptional regulator [Paenibacillus phocaensis]|uniref:LacI family DNA-binding transcriptional regulator n=1 Tax=Paenibacillus phocaensis TaxID=1776378 RepID=UPI000839C1BB|nr:LacI family DNA-binding transcriptional regulator [Paenibacillus phocaensis]
MQGKIITTIEDIAREAKVSISTVSRVINNSKAVSPQLKDRVNEVIQKYNFKPNSLARGLVSKRTHTLGIIIPDISNTIFGSLTKGINSICQKMGYTLVVCESGGNQEKEIELLEVLSDKKIDGVLFAGVNVNSVVISEMKNKDYPIVLVTREAVNNEGNLHTVIHDNEGAVYDAMQFLIEHGHKQIAFISGSKDDYSSGQKRLEGYLRALRENHLKEQDSYIQYGNFSFDSGYKCMQTIYEENEELPTAVMISSDLMAIGAITFLKTTNLQVPEDISIMGFDDMDLASYFTPKLSTVRISYFDEGVKAAKTIMKLIAKKASPPSIQYIPHKIIRRNSVIRLNSMHK